MNPWVVVAILGAGGWVLDKGGEFLEGFGDAAEGSAQMTKWVTVAGVAYVSVQALKASGALK